MLDHVPYNVTLRADINRTLIFLSFLLCRNVVEMSSNETQKSVLRLLKHPLLVRHILIREFFYRHHSPPPPPPPSTSTAQTRQKIVEIIAGTANGCLSELGYFPGMPQRFKELEDQNAQWRLENMKLFQDNASLLELIHQQNERIKEMRAPDSEKNIRIMELNSELQKTRIQRDELARAQSASNRTPSQLQQDFAILQGDYLRIITGYRSKCAEVERLQHQVRALIARPQPQAWTPQAQTQYRPQHQPQQAQQQAQQQNRPQVQQHPQHQLQQQFQQQSRPQIQHQFQPLHQLVYVQRPQPNHLAQQQSAPTLLQPHVQKRVQQHSQSVPAISGPQPGQQYSLSQTQQAIFEQRYQAILLSQHHRPRQSSGSMPGTRCFNFLIVQKVKDVPVFLFFLFLLNTSTRSGQVSFFYLPRLG